MLNKLWGFGTLRVIKIEWYKDEKNRIILYLSIGIIAFLLIAMFNYDEHIEKCAEIKMQNNTCWFVVTDEDGNGFGTLTDYCVQLKQNCESKDHKVSCEWTNEGQKGCYCK